MKTLLQPGDKVKIREDIKHQHKYKMKTNNREDVYLSSSMVSPGTIVTIKRVLHDTYRLEEEGLCNYTDEMFEPDLINYLYEEYLNNK
jgi:hypothetical protein